MDMVDDIKKFPRRRALFGSLRARLIIAFSLLFVVVIILVGATYFLGLPFTRYSGRLRQQREEVFRSLNLVADLKKERLVRWLEERRDDAQVAATNEWVENNVALLRAATEKLMGEGGAVAEGLRFGDRLQNVEAFENLVEYMKNMMLAYGVYKRIQIIDAATGIIIMSTDGKTLGDNVSDREYFRGALLFQDEYLSDIELAHHPDAEEPVLHVSHPIFGPKGEVSAILVLEVSANDIIGPILHLGEGLGKRGEALLINQDVKILTSLKHPLADGTRAKPLEYRIKAEPAVRAAGGEEGIIEAKDYRGEPVLAAYRHIRLSPDIGWGMVVKRDKAELYAPLRLDLISTAVTALLGICAMIFLTILIARGLTSPLLALSRTAIEVAEGDLDARATVTTSDEVGELATTFNAMLDRIEERTGELAAVNKELESFSYSVSHDLRAPLRSMDGFSQVLLEDYSDKLDAEGQDYLRRVRAASQRMGQLIDDLLSLSRLSRGSMRREFVNLSKLAHEITASLQESEPERKVELNITPGVVAMGDSRLLGVVMENLLGNAWKFTQKRLTTKIEFGYTEIGSRTAYFVRDNGAGFDMQYADKLFGAFQRLHSTAEFKGTGIGLATAQRIINRHGGKIWAKGEVDKGATFYFTL